MKMEIKNVFSIVSKLFWKSCHTSFKANILKTKIKTKTENNDFCEGNDNWLKSILFFLFSFLTVYYLTYVLKNIPKHNWYIFYTQTNLSKNTTKQNFRSDITSFLGYFQFYFPIKNKIIFNSKEIKTISNTNLQPFSISFTKTILTIFFFFSFSFLKNLLNKCNLKNVFIFVPQDVQKHCLKHVGNNTYTTYDSFRITI